MLWVACFYPLSFELNSGLKWVIRTAQKNIDDSFGGFTVPEFRNFALLAVSVKNPETFF